MSFGGIPFAAADDDDVAAFSRTPPRLRDVSSSSVRSMVPPIAGNGRCCSTCGACGGGGCERGCCNLLVGITDIEYDVCGGGLDAADVARSGGAAVELLLVPAIDVAAAAFAGALATFGIMRTNCDPRVGNFLMVIGGTRGAISPL